eukprot:scaffold2480_cov205-Alexandrium_tamarense.AAC.3
MGNATSIESYEHDPKNKNSRFNSSTIPPRGPLLLQRKGSSFLEEPLCEKHTERGESPMSPETVPTTKSLSVNEKLRYAVSEMQGWRSHMEDKHTLCPPLSYELNTQLEDHYLFAVFDGHGGNFTSHYAGENLVSTLTSSKEWRAYLELPKTNPAGHKSRGDVSGLKLLKSALSSTFLSLDDQIREAQRNRRLDQLNELETIMANMGHDVFDHDIFQSGSEDNMMIQSFVKPPPPSMPANVQLERSGSTGVVVLITPTHIICANAGDSRAILTRNGLALPLSFDHKPNNDVEVSRVDNAGGFVRNGRVDGDLAVSRSFGDFSYKAHGYMDVKGQRVSVVPDIIIHPRDYGKDEYIVLACDGVWDRLTNRDCSTLVRTLLEEGETDVGLMCEEVIDTALELDSRDNMTCAVVVFPAAKASVVPTKAKKGDAVGVMKRRADRERTWGPHSTVASRAQTRLEERKRKNKAVLNMQRSRQQQQQQQQQQIKAQQVKPQPVKVQIKAAGAGSAKAPKSKLSRKNFRVSSSEVSVQ